MKKLFTIGEVAKRFTEENQYQMTCAAHEITMIDTELTNDTSKYMTELQIPVKKT